MDLGLRHRPIWIAASSASLSLEIARTCLEEGAFVCLFDPVDGDLVRELKLRHGLWIRVAEPPGHQDRADAVDRAVRWAGAPFGVVAALTQADDELAALVSHLQPGGALVLFKALQSDQAESNAPWSELREDRQLWLSALAPTVRVSVVGLAAGASAAVELGGRRNDDSYEPHGLSALVTFLLGVGPGQLAHVDEVGSIHLG